MENKVHNMWEKMWKEKKWQEKLEGNGKTAAYPWGDLELQGYFLACELLVAHMRKYHDTDNYHAFGHGPMDWTLRISWGYLTQLMVVFCTRSFSKFPKRAVRTRRMWYKFISTHSNLGVSIGDVKCK